ncbi:DNA transfer protein [Providencia vermicola]|uniref:DNA transfer protein n=1 Tax=Providencia vermicola TaxID=333965 RepID=UPI0032DABBAC
MSGYVFKLARKLAGEEPAFYEGGGKGGGGGGDSSAAQAQATKYAADLQNQQFERVMNGLAPFTPLAGQYINQLKNLSSPEGAAQALGQYYNSQQFNDYSNQARYQNLAAAEAMGGLGSTATSNSLASIAPALGESWLNGQMNNYNNLANIGLGALQGQANAGQTYANNAGQLSQQNAALAAANANRPSGMQQAVTGGLGGGALGYGIASALGTSTPWGMGIGAGLGILGSIF